ncbi:CBS domain-containing protein [Salarchaeum sp. JOR-1]|uniref:CBS domain-containing protein n=1 Tax=Salarchaeum sp. JOR-1 TaxID=2599399 RepID=UPI0011987983|nr:CBS domain-containing protein [Salarchaeum sp. JOR-1]QDX41667.1 CBS domain-containing protein [Salarchaeum sp. JOR-1]
MEDIFVGRVMSAPIQTVTPDTPVEEAASVMRDNDISSVVVVDEENGLAGILTATDFVTIAADGAITRDDPVSKYMSTDLVTVTADEPIVDAADTLIEHGIHHVPVVDDTAGVIGMISTTDITAYLSTAA